MELTAAAPGATLLRMSWRVVIGCLGSMLALGCSGSALPGTQAYPPDGGDVATISLSASTNTPSVLMIVYSNAAADEIVGPTVGAPGYSSTYPPGSPDVVAFLSDLAAVGNVAAIPTGDQCSKSVSFGTTTTVSAGGNTSGDLQCLTDPTAAEVRLVMDCARLVGD